MITTQEFLQAFHSPFYAIRTFGSEAKNFIYAPDKKHPENEA